MKICEDNNTVIAKQPFLKDPVEFLMARHNNSNNYDQALKVYRGQCRKSEEQRQDMKLVHQELVENDFMKKLSDFDEDTQNCITNAAFQHYNPWRIVLKEAICLSLLVNHYPLKQREKTSEKYHIDTTILQSLSRLNVLIPLKVFIVIGGDVI